MEKNRGIKKTSIFFKATQLITGRTESDPQPVVLAKMLFYLLSRTSPGRRGDRYKHTVRLCMGTQENKGRGNNTDMLDLAWGS